MQSALHLDPLPAPSGERNARTRRLGLLFGAPDTVTPKGSLPLEYLFAVGGSARASRALFGALAEHRFRSARAPTGAAEAAALPDAQHIRVRVRLDCMDAAKTEAT